MRAPRVILFGNDAKFVMTFNGEPEQRGYNALELLEYNSSTQSFQLQEILFPHDQKTASNTNSAVHFSEKNPGKCLACHGSNPRPIWDTPPLWPGAYGEKYQAHLSEQESTGLYAFLTLQPTHPRYQFLTSTRIYADHGTFYPTHNSIYSASTIEPPNAQLTRLFTVLNNEKMVRQVISHPHFNDYKYALLASVSSHCSNVTDYFPAEWQNTMASTYQRFAFKTDSENHLQVQKKLERSIAGQSGLTHNISDVSSFDTLLNFRFIIETGLKMSTTQWSMELEKNNTDFTSFQPIASQIEQLLLRATAEQDPLLMEQYYLNSYEGKNKYCIYLKKRSLSNLSTLNTLATPDAPTAHPVAPMTAELSQQPASTDSSQEKHQRLTSLIELCADCHTSGVAPYIQYDQPKALLKSLQNKPDSPDSTHKTILDESLYRLSSQAGAKRMPPTANLSDAEQQELIAYLLSLPATTKP